MAVSRLAAVSEPGSLSGPAEGIPPGKLSAIIG